MRASQCLAAGVTKGARCGDFQVFAVFLSFCAIYLQAPSDLVLNFGLACHARKITGTFVVYGQWNSEEVDEQWPVI